MRMLFCRSCADLKKITKQVRFCACRKSFAREISETRVRYGGIEASILGLSRDDVEILRGPASDTPEYGVHKLLVLAPVVGRRAASTLEFVG